MKETEYNFMVGKVNASYEFISGKYYHKNSDDEIVGVENMQKEIYQLCKNSNMIPKPADIDNLVETLRYESTKTKWPELYKNVRAKHHEKLAFPLDNKQLQILNILLFHPEEEVMFITTGIGGSGKSTFLNIIKQLFNNDFCSVPLSMLNGFNLADALTHRLICSDEIGAKDLDSDCLKTIISKQGIFINPKYAHGYQLPFTQSTLFYCCNKVPYLDISDTGILRRIVYYERNTKIENPDKSLKNKEFAKEELRAFVEEAKCYENSNWKDMFEEDTLKYVLKNNSVYKYFVRYNGSNLNYPAYADYCRNFGFKACSYSSYDEIMQYVKDHTKKVKDIKLNKKLLDPDIDDTELVNSIFEE